MPHSSCRGRRPRRLPAFAASAVLLAGVGVVGAPSALAADPAPDTSASHASAQFLSGTWSTEGATASYAGNGAETPGGATEAYHDIAAGGGAPGIALGSEYAYAGTGGSSWAASGWLTGATPGSGTAGQADIDLSDALAAAGLSGLLSEFQLQIQQIASIAKFDAATYHPADGLANGCGDWADENVSNCLDYTIAVGKLHLQSPAVEALYHQILAAAQDLDDALGAFTKSDVEPGPASRPLTRLAIAGAIAGAARGSHFPESFAVVDGNITTQITVTSEVAQTLVGVLSNGSFGGVDIDFADGTVDVDLSEIMGPWNGLDANTPLFDASLFDQIAAAVDSAVDAAVGQVVAKVMAMLNSVHVDVSISTAGKLHVLWWSTCTGSVFGHEFAYDCLKSETGPFAVTAGYSGGFLDVVTGNGAATVSFTTSSAKSDVMDLIAFLNGAGLESGVKDLVEALSDDGFLDKDAIQDQITGLLSRAADFVKDHVDTGTAHLGARLRSLATAFNGTINAQSATADGGSQVSALVLRFGKDAAAFATPAKLRASSSAFAAALPLPKVVVAIPDATIRLGTAEVGPNATEGVCAAPAVFDPATGACLMPPPDPGTPGSSGTPAGGGAAAVDSSTAPVIEVAGASNEVDAPSDAVTKPEVAVQDATEEIVPAAPELAATGPHQTGLIALIGLELLLAGIAVSRLATRRGRIRHGRS